MTLTALEETAHEVPVDRDAVRRPLSWRAALWSVISVRWAAVALALFLAGLTAQLQRCGRDGVVDAVSGLLSHRRLGIGVGRCKSVAQQGP